MANVPGTFYTAETQRRGTTPVSPPSAVDDPIDPVNPSGPPVVPPVAERYASEAAMIADQLNQKSGYLYFDGTDTWWYIGTTNGDITDYEAFGGGGGVQSVTGDGVDNTDPDNPVLSFPTPAEIGAQDDLGTDIVAALEGANVPSGSNVFATMADVGSGGADANAVHYNAADSKSASEKYQARTNIGSLSGEPQVITDSGTITTIGTRTSNVLVFTGASVTLQNLGSGGFDGEQIAIINFTGSRMTISTNDGSPLDGRFVGGAGLNTSLEASEILICYFTTKWQMKNFTGFVQAVSFTGSASSSSLGLLSIFNSNTGGVTFSINNGTTKYFEINGSGLVRSNSGAYFTRPSASGTSSAHIEFHARAGQPTNHFNAFSKDAAGSIQWGVFPNGNVLQARSTASNESIRRDEKRLYEVVTVTTSGSINDQALTDAIFNYRFTAATSITGFGNGEIGRTIDIDNATGATLTIEHENTGSIAANRIKLIGAAAIVMPIDGKMTIKYCTGSRWELVSKNF